MSGHSLDSSVHSGQRSGFVAVELGDYLDIADVMLLTLGVTGTVSHINRTGCEFLGCDETDILGQDWVETFLPPSARRRVTDLCTQIMGGDPSPVEHFESPVLTRSGTERLIIWHAAPIRVAEGRTVGMILSGRDMSAVSRGDASLTQLVNDLAQTKYALDESAIVATTDVTGTITYVNDTFCTISKYARDELLGQDHRIINSGSHPKEFFRGLWTTIANGRIWKGEIRNRAKDGSIYWVDTTIVPFVDAQGKPYQYMAIRFDITERKRVEALVRDRQALARLGEMAAVVAHEVKNPLAGISGALQVIASRLPADSSDRAIIGDIEQRIGSLNNMVQDLLLFARPTPPTFASTAIAVLLADTATALSQDPELEDVEVAIGGDQPTLAMDRDQLRIVFQNLLLNAAQAMDGRGTIHVEVLARDGTCEVRVRDDGRGLTPDVLVKIFEPFFTTKHRGSGLGLPTARRIVEAHGGRLTAHSRPEGGAVFVASLPMP